MKTKLLKKIRRAYSITKVESLGSHSSEWYERVKENLGLPFYVVRKHGDQYGFETEAHSTYQKAKDDILHRVIIKYSRKFRYKPSKQTKVWYNK